MPNYGNTAKLVFTFPGQGSYSHRVLHELYESYPFSRYFSGASRITERILGRPFLDLVKASTPEQHDSLLQACPELDQVGIYVTEVLLAHVLMKSGLRPDFLLGHSLGELAALAVSGAFSFEDGVRIVCQRSAALQQFSEPGKMAAVSCGAEKAREILQQLPGTRLELAVINHSKQTVLSGPSEELERLAGIMAGQGISLSVLKSRYPFHSSLLQPAVGPFRLALCSYEFASPGIPVYLGTEKRFHSADVDLAQALPQQFIKQLDFAGALQALYGEGCRRFVECGAGNIVTRISETAFTGLPGVTVYPSARIETGTVEGLRETLRAFGFAEPDTEALGKPSDAEVNTLLHQLRSMVMETSASPKPPAAPAVVSFSADHDSGKDAAREPVLSAAETSWPAEPCPVLPIAIVAMDCVLPGAHDAEEFWNNVENGVSGIVDLAQTDPSMKLDFMGGTNAKTVPDKTYTLLHGSVPVLSYEDGVPGSSFTESQFNTLTREEKLLALAATRSLRNHKSLLASLPSDRIQCVLGATADGCSEYDEALFLQAMEARLEHIEANPDRRAAFKSDLRRVWGEQDGSTRDSQHASFTGVMERVLGKPVRTYITDAACSSSLYAINLGMKALRNGECDAAIVGGVFAPGPANNTLFAQFHGLTPSGSRPFDTTADGVVFGDGVGILLLRRLTDAISSGDRVLGVLRAMGVSSDGKSPAINVPQSGGQSVAIRKAYQDSGIDVNTIQYVEAHATATPVGDAVEFQALRNSLPRDPSLPRIELGSVKALIGHTGWAAGVASVIKICKAFEKRVVPPQYNYRSSGAEFALAGSQFNISVASQPWPGNVGRVPRRAAINGFGFGGTNAHLVLEEYNEPYHRNLCAGVASTPAESIKLAVVAAASLFPAADRFDSPAPTSQKQFARQSMPLPKGKMLLPDVKDHMDPGQYLVLLMAERVFSALPESWKQLRRETGVAIGVESKTDRGVAAIQRIFLDRLKRRFAEDSRGSSLAQAQRDAILSRLAEAIQRDVLPSGPYTLPGLMPNVISGRVANMFDLNGPNIVVDMGQNSMFQAIRVAAEFLNHNDCKLVLAGGLNALQLAPDHAEAGFLMALTTLEIAKEHALPVKCTLSFGDLSGSGKQFPARKNNVSYRGAEGVIEIAAALSRVEEKKDDAVLPDRLHEAGQTYLKFGAYPPQEPKREETTAPSTYAYVQGTPIYHYTPVGVPENIPDIPTALASLRKRKILFLIDQAEPWKRLENAGALDVLDYRVMCPEGVLGRSMPVDLTSDETLRKTLDSTSSAFDTVVAVKFAEGGSADAFLSLAAERDSALVDLLFGATRSIYDRIQSKKVALGTLCLNAFHRGRLHPCTGLLAGFMKSVARELPAGLCRIVNTTEGDFGKALLQLESEFHQPGAIAEVCYEAGIRKVIRFAPIEQVASGTDPLLDSDSVVLATGGGRGVTAVLAEELLTRFGCTVIALGRTDPRSAPPEVLEMSVEQLAEYEPAFYKSELARGKGKKITQLKNLFRSFQAAHEIHATVQRLSALQGRFEYISADITNGEAVASTVRSVFEKYGGVNMVLHGAGVQISKALTKKSVEDFRSVVRAKLLSLRHIYTACERHRNNRPVHYNLLTSAFSAMGNDGQPDYGAANEALNRVADIMDTAGAGSWCSVGWLGWAGIGMTRGSEYAALAASRRLRGITKEEGQEIFSKFLTGKPAAPVNILLAEGELSYYNVPVVREPFVPQAIPAAARSRKNEQVIEREIAVDEAPYLLDHLVDGVPTLPGAFLIMIVAEAALELRPDLKVIAFEDASFRRFVRLPKDQPRRLRLSSKVVAEDDNSTLVRVEVLSDFIHKSGVVLQKDAVQTAISVRLAPTLESPRQRNGHHRPVDGRLLDDPYVMDGSPIRLDGPFRTMQNIVADNLCRTAEYKTSDKVVTSDSYRYLPNLLVMDSLWRFGAIDRDTDEAMPVYVPEACKVMRVYYDLSNPDMTVLSSRLTLTGSNPHTEEEDRLIIGPVEARSAAGATLLMVDGGLCRKLGEVRSVN